MNANELNGAAYKLDINSRVSMAQVSEVYDQANRLEKLLSDAGIPPKAVGVRIPDKVTLSIYNENKDNSSSVISHPTDRRNDKGAYIHKEA